MEKRGSSLTINQLILLAIGLVVFIVVVLIFFNYSGTFVDKLKYFVDMIFSTTPKK